MRIPDRSRLALILCSAVLVLALAATLAGQWWLHVQHAHESRDADVRSAADDAVTAVLSYDYRRLKAGIADTTPLLTGDAKQQYVELQKPLMRSAPRLKATVEARVKTMSVLESDDDSARVLLFVDQVSTSTKLSRPQVDQSRVVVTLQRTDGRWLVSTLAAI